MALRHLLVFMAFFLWAFSCEEQVMPEDDLVTRIVGQVVDDQGNPVANVPVTYIIATTPSRISPTSEVLTHADGTFEIFTRYATRCNFLDVNGFLDNWEDSRFPLTEGELLAPYAGAVLPLPGDVTDVDLRGTPVVVEHLAELKVIPFDTIVDYLRLVQPLGGVNRVFEDCSWGLSSEIRQEETLRLAIGDMVTLVRQYQDSARQVVDTITLDQAYQEVVL
jgi:hypothetical protein